MKNLIKTFSFIYLSISLNAQSDLKPSPHKQVGRSELTLILQQTINASLQNETAAKANGTKPACLLDSAIYHYPGTGTYVTETKTVNAYNPFYSPSTRLIYNRTSLSYSWTPSSKTDMIYSNQEKLLSEVQQQFSNSIWINNSKTTYTYDIHNNPSSKILSFWNQQTNAWKTVSKNSYTYTANNSLVNELSQTVDQVTGLYLNSSRYTYTNDIFNHPISILIEYWNGNVNLWENVEKINLTYSGDQLASLIAYEWNPSNTSWRNFYKSTATFDSQNNITTSMIQIWNISANSWQNDRKYLYSYSSNKNKLSETWQQWDPNSSSWQNSNRYLYTYNSNNYETSILSQGITNNSSWYDLELTNKYYNCLTIGINEIHENNSSTLIYPNPTHSILHIQSEQEFTQIKVVSLSGQVLITSDFTSSLNVSSLENGIYVILLSTKNQEVGPPQKFVKHH